MREPHLGRNEPASAGQRDGGKPPADGAARPFVAFGLAATIAVGATLGLQFSLLPAVLVAATLLAAAGFGLPGLGLGVAAAAGLHFAATGAWPALSRTEVLLCLVGGVAVGVVSDLERWRARPQAGAHLGGRGAAFPPAIDRWRALSWPGAIDLAMRPSLALLVPAAAVAIGASLGDPRAVIALALGAAAVGSGLGRLAGGVAGVGGALAAAADVPPVDTAILVSGLGALGLVTGALSRRSGLRGRALRALINGGAAIEAAAMEQDVRAAMVAALTGLSRNGDAWIEEGPAAGAPEAPAPGRGGVRNLVDGDGRVFARAVWRYGDGGGAAFDAAAAALVDLAAARLARLRLEAAKDHIEEAARIEHLRTVLLDAVSHHFRSPLSGILGSVTSVLGMPGDGEPAVRRKLLLIVRDQAYRLSRYVDNFISVARLESGAVDVNLSEVSLEVLIYDVWESLGESGGARRFLASEIDPAPVRTDPTLLAQVLGNVLENAIKYSPEGSTVDLLVRRADGRLDIRVENASVGPTPPDLERIFERFYRSRANAAPGLGLGLYITRSLVRVLGGEVTASPRDHGTGLAIDIVLPLNEPVQ